MDGIYKGLTYTAGLLTQGAGKNLDGDTVTKTLGYTDGLLTSVT